MVCPGHWDQVGPELPAPNLQVTEGCFAIVSMTMATSKAPQSKDHAEDLLFFGLLCLGGL